MKDSSKIKQKLIASALLTLFGLSQTGIATFAVNDYVNYGGQGNSEFSSPIIRGIDDSNGNIRLTGDVSFTSKQSPVTLSLRDSDVSQVLRMFADKAGYNIIFFTDDINDKVTMDLVNVPLNSAFSMVMEKAKLTYAIKDNTLIIAKAGDDSFKMTQQEISLLPVRYVSASAIAEFLNKNIYSKASLGSAGKDIAVTNPATNSIMIFGSKQDVQIAKKIISEFDKKPTYSTFKVNHTTPEEMAGMICDMLMPSIGAATGGAAGIVTGFASEDGGSSSESSSGSSSSSSSGGGGGGSAIQIGGGAVACTLSSDMSAGDYASMGIQNLSVAYFSQLGTISILGGSESQVEMIKDFVAQMDKKQPQAYLEVNIIELSEDGSKALSNVWNLNTDFLSISFNDGTTGTNPIHPIVIGKKFKVYDPNSYNDDGSYGQIGQYARSLDGKSLTWAINYVISNAKGRVVANPKILITNGQESVIDLTSDYIESVDTEYQTGGMGSFSARTYNIGSDNGIKVSIVPFISPDGYVTLNISPEYSTIKSQLTQVDEYQNEYIAATMLQRRNLDLKNIRIKDGETLVIGGMIQERESKTVKKIPGLGDLPVIGAAFRSTTTTRAKEEMVIMITPKILIDSEDAISTNNSL
jgi:type II secretory pathway component GspD/PulD (secretin)